MHNPLITTLPHKLYSDMLLSAVLKMKEADHNVIYLDFKKAFNSVAHNELLVKLWNFGITGSLWNWFKT